MKEVTSAEYWERYWGNGKPRDPVYDKSRGVFLSYDQLIGDCFARSRSRIGERQLRFLDCGCGEGLILRFVAEQYPGTEVWGIEYCDAIERARSMGRELGLNLHLIRQDLLEEPLPELLGAFDVVASFGLIEHFTEPAKILRRIKGFVESGGWIITVIPNFQGMYNLLWKLYDSANYQHHVPIRWQAFLEAHVAAGLVDVQFRTIGPPSVPRPHSGVKDRGRLLHKLTGLVNTHLFHRFWPSSPNPAKRYPMTPLIACMARKPT
jgi:2-polyprenyl-3-methyl-5-hydroxy-6-metoxy-1,4-benzoquinol methylase